MCNFTEDNATFSCEDTFETVSSNFEEDISIVISWFRASQMVDNPSKFQVLLGYEITSAKQSKIINEYGPDVRFPIL